MNFDDVAVNFKIAARFVGWPDFIHPNNMYARVVCHPPLGQATLISNETNTV